MRGAGALLGSLAACLAAHTAAQRDGKGRGVGTKPLYPSPPDWFPGEGDILDYDFEKWGHTHTPDGKLQQRPEPMLETLGCILGRIRPAHGGRATEVLGLLIPKTGTRHLQTIMDKEYGRREFMTRCHPAPVFHFAPRSDGTMFSDDWAPDDSCKDEALRTFQRNTIIWNQITSEMNKRSLKLITVVRQPVPYFLSFFSFRLGFDPKNESTLPELARFVERRALSSNMQLGFLVRKRNYGERCHKGHAPDVTEEDLTTVSTMMDKRELLAGTCEQLEATVRMFAHELRWQKFSPDTYGSFEPRQTGAADTFRNGDVTSVKLRESDLTAEMVTDIRRVNELDQRLYDDVSRRLSEYVPPSLEL